MHKKYMSKIFESLSIILSNNREVCLKFMSIKFFYNSNRFLTVLECLTFWFENILFSIRSSDKIDENDEDQAEQTDERSGDFIFGRVGMSKLGLTFGLAKL
ncbi:hypothetical protein BpHYR1_007080 [Brachionus plicatilis]|uniref:Uncharacterized protein n=1 Tax=Brachionus plicatilis TaxID=10195 RepID=A0A3M7PLI5_BRAPC|nr:hypothetical protein BpHYR1_007080 [Brachionus plicatilis]